MGLCVVVDPLLLFALITDFDSSRAILLNTRRWDVCHPFLCLPTIQELLQHWTELFEASVTLLWAHPPLQTYSPCKERKKPYAQQHWWAVQRIPWKGRTKISILSSKELLSNYTDTSLMWVSLQFSHSISIPSSTPLFLCRVSTLCPQTQMPHSSWCTDKKGLKFMGLPPPTFWEGSLGSPIIISTCPSVSHFPSPQTQ